MTGHWHVSIENVAIYGASAILVIQALRIASSFLVKAPGPAATAGKALGALVHFGG